MKNSVFAKTHQRAGGKNKQTCRSVNWFNCGKPGHYARMYLSAPKQNGPQQNGKRNINYNKTKQYAHKVSAIEDDNDEVVDEDTKEKAVGYTSNNINNVPSCGVNKSPFYDARKLAGVP